MRPYAPHKMKWAWIIIKKKEKYISKQEATNMWQENWKHTHTSVSQLTGSISTHNLPISLYVFSTRFRYPTSSGATQTSCITAEHASNTQNENLVLLKHFEDENVHLKCNWEMRTSAHMFFLHLWLSAYVARARRLWSMALFVVCVFFSASSLVSFCHRYFTLHFTTNFQSCSSRCSKICCTFNGRCTVSRCNLISTELCVSYAGSEWLASASFSICCPLSQHRYI